MKKRFLTFLTLIALLPLMPILGAVKVKSASEIAKKWGEVTPGRQAYYEAGASVAGDDWARETTAAGPAYRAGVTQANIEQLFRGGVKRAGAEKYNRKVKDVGANRYGPGVQAAVSDMEQGMAPMVETIQALTLTQRQPRGNTSNYRRVEEVGTALHKKRLALRAVG